MCIVPIAIAAAAFVVVAAAAAAVIAMIIAIFEQQCQHGQGEAVQATHTASTEPQSGSRSTLRKNVDRVG